MREGRKERRGRGKGQGKGERKIKGLERAMPYLLMIENIII